MSSATSNAVPLLQADTLLEKAKAQTGFSDVGDETLVTRLRLVVDYINSFSLDAAGQEAARDVCLWLLTSRLQFIEDRTRYPIAAEKIERPLFATGEPRSGTTLLHALLATDPNARALRFWEVMYPSPPPGLATSDDPRRALADEDWRDILRRLPQWLVSHPYNDMLGDGLPECERTWAWDFRVVTPTAWWRVPIEMNIGLPADPATQYRLHKMMLQHCQYARPKKYWVLKGFHGARLAALFDTYPDARLIWTHRDPVQLLASKIKLLGELIEGMAGRPLDWREHAATQLRYTRAGIHAVMTDPMAMDPRVHHVRYQDFVANPVATIRGFYEKCDVPFGSDTEAAMQHYLQNNRGDRYGKFTYSTDLIGEDIDALHAEFAPYRERFGIDIEQRN